MKFGIKSTQRTTITPNLGQELIILRCNLSRKSTNRPSACSSNLRKTWPFPVSPFWSEAASIVQLHEAITGEKIHERQQLSFPYTEECFFFFLFFSSSLWESVFFQLPSSAGIPPSTQRCEPARRTTNFSGHSNFHKTVFSQSIQPINVQLNFNFYFVCWMVYFTIYLFLKRHLY